MYNDHELIKQFQKGNQSAYDQLVKRHLKYGVHQCRQSFVTNSAGTIVSWSYNGCPRFVRNW